MAISAYYGSSYGSSLRDDLRNAEARLHEQVRNARIAHAKHDPKLIAYLGKEGESAVEAYVDAVEMRR